MTGRKALTIGGGLTLAALLYSLWVYPALPAMIPIHWDLNGRIDGWGDKRWAAFFGPGGMLVILGLLAALPRLSPRSFAVENFRSTFSYLMLLVVVLLGYIHVIMLQAGLHPDRDLGRPLVVGLLIFFAVMGNVLGRTRRNFWMGVRTPWTLSSDRVWNATHRLAGRLLVATGSLGALAVWLGAPIGAALGVLMAALLWPVVYSFLLYKRLDREGDT